MGSEKVGKAGEEDVSGMVRKVLHFSLRCAGGNVYHRRGRMHLTAKGRQERIKSRRVISVNRCALTVTYWYVSEYK